MMTNGPAARIGEILEVPFARPRTRHDVLRRSDYDAVKARVLGFLARHDQHTAAPAATRNPVAHEPAFPEKTQPVVASTSVPAGV